MNNQEVLFIILKSISLGHIREPDKYIKIISKFKLKSITIYKLACYSIANNLIIDPVKYAKWIISLEIK